MDINRHQHIAIIVLVGVAGIIGGYLLFPARHASAPVGHSSANYATSTVDSSPSANPDITGLSVVSVYDASNTLYLVTGEYPQFDNASAAFNTAIANFVNADLVQFKQNTQENNQARIETSLPGTSSTLPPQSFTFNVSWEPTQINSRYISIVVRIGYFDGGANGTEDLKTFNYDVAAGKIMALGDLFPAVPNYLTQISQISRGQLSESLTDASGNSVPLTMIESGTAPNSSNFANFVFGEQTVTIYFEKYQVAPGSFGEQHVTIVRGAIN